MANSNLYRINLQARVDTKTIKAQIAQIEKSTTLNVKVNSAGATQTVKEMNKVNRSTMTASAAFVDITKKVALFGAATSIIGGFTAACGAAMQAVLDFDKSLTEMKKVSSLSGQELDNYTKKLAELGEQTARSRSEMVDASTEFIKSGFSEDDAAELARVATMMQNVADSEMDAGTAANFITSQLKAFKLDAADAETILDGLNEVSNNFAVSSTDISSGLSKTSSAMGALGNDYQQTIGLLTAGTEILQNQSGKVARGLRTIGNNFANAAKEADSFDYKVQGTTKSLSLIDDQTNDMKSTFQIFSDLKDDWDKMSNSEKQALAISYAGKNQFEVMVATLDNMDTALAATETAYNSMGSAVKENEAYLSSIEAKSQAFKAAFQELALTFINSDFVKQIIDLGTALLKFANTDLGQTIIKIAAFSASLKALGLIVGKLGLIESFTKLGKAIKSAFIFTETTQNFSNLYGVFGKANQTANTLYGTVTKTSTGFTALAKNAKTAIGAMSGFSKVALALGAMYGLAKVFMYIAEKPARDLEKSQNNLEEIKSKMSNVADEISTLEKKQKNLAKSGKDLADSEKERLAYLKKQTAELKEQSLTEAKSGLKSAYKSIGTVKDPYATGSTQYFQEEKAAQALVNQYKKLQEQYKNNKITQAEFINGADQLITRLTPLYNQYEAIIEAGGTLEGVDKGLYVGIEEIAAAFVNAGGKCSFYNSALATVSSNSTVAKYVVEQFTDTLVEEGGTYKFVSAAARAEAQEVLNLEAQKTKATLQQVNSRIAMRLAEYSSFAGLASSESGLRGRRNADGSYSYATQAEKEAAQLAQTYYKLKNAASAVSKMGVQTSSITPSVSPSTKDGTSSASSKAEKESEKIKKILEELNDKYLESYQRREITASKYYNTIHKKAQAYRKKGLIEADTYKEYLETAAKNIFEEIQYRYDNGIYSASTYYTKMTTFANKFYKKNGKYNRITYEEYREYMKKAVEATIESLDEQYEKGKISAEDYYNKVKKLASKAKKNGILSTKEYKEYIEDAYEKMFDSIENEFDRGKINGTQYFSKITELAEQAKNDGIISAKKYQEYVEDAYDKLFDAIADMYERGKVTAKEYYNLVKTKGAEALKANAISADELADRLEAAAEAVKDMAQVKLDAFEFFAEEKKLAIDKLIDAEQTRIDQLNEQLDAMQEQNDLLDAQAERMELVNALAEAKKQKIRIFDERLGWVWVSDPKAVSEAQQALDEFDEKKKREEAEKAIEKEIANIEKVIENYEAQKQAYDDLIDAQSRALQRWELEQELGMTVEQAVLQGRLDNFTNFKTNYIAGVNEMISALQQLAAAQELAEQMKIEAAQQQAEASAQAAKKVDEWNKYATEEISALQQAGKNVYITKDSKGQLHWSKVSAEKAASYSDDSTSVVKVKKTTPVETTLSTGKTITTKPYNYKGKASGSRGIAKSDLYNVNEFGDELFVPSSGNLAYLTKGTGVVPAHLTSNLMDLGQYNMAQWARIIGNSVGGGASDSHDIIIQNMTVKSDNADNFVRQLQNLSILKK